VAETLKLGEYEFKKRSPLGVWGLSIITIFVYYFVWYFKINREARDYLGDQNIKPGVALLAVLLGWVLIVPPFISVYHTGQRIERMEEKAGVQQTISPALGLLASFVYMVHMIYMQEHLNRVWNRYLQSQPAQQAGPAPPGGGGFTP
jgi:hypothetical protein